MELEMEMLNALSLTLERLQTAVNALEISANRMDERQAGLAGDVQRITAAVDAGGAEVSGREQALERRLAEAEQEIARLLAQDASRAEKPTYGESVRKTLPPSTVQLLAKQGIDSFGSMEMSSVDAALAGLNIEQRMAVKAQLIRAGALIA